MLLKLLRSYISFVTKYASAKNHNKRALEHDRRPDIYSAVLSFKWCDADRCHFLLPFKIFRLGQGARLDQMDLVQQTTTTPRRAVTDPCPYYLSSVAHSSAVISTNVSEK